jgi:membrane associated rhomboid family serine protease
MTHRNEEDRRLWRSLLYPAVGVSLLWIIYLVAWLADWPLGQLGVYPRLWSGLAGILTAPLAHGSWSHLVSNSVPLLVLSAGVLYFYREVKGPVLITAYLAPGLWVWVAARSSYHIGASGMVYALAFFLFFSGVFRRDFRSLALALVVAFFYGSMVWGVFPMEEGVSWESHLFGGLAGVVMAWYFRKRGPSRKTYSWEDEPDESPYDATAPWNYQSLFPPPEDDR